MPDMSMSVTTTSNGVRSSSSSASAPLPANATSHSSRSGRSRRRSPSSSFGSSSTNSTLRAMIPRGKVLLRARRGGEGQLGGEGGSLGERLDEEVVGAGRQPAGQLVRLTAARDDDDLLV